MSPGSFASLSQSNEVAFRVEFDGKVPAPQHLYWRGPVLTGFDGVPLNKTKLKISVNDELQINTDKPVDQPLRYRASSILSDRFTSPAPAARSTLITTGSNPKARAFAQQMRAEYPDDTELANALMRWFNSEPFHYTLSPPKLGRNSIDDFIFDSRGLNWEPPKLSAVMQHEVC